MKQILAILIIFIPEMALSQTAKKHTEATPAVLAKLQAEIDKGITAYRNKLVKLKYEPLNIEFVVDTFRIEELTRKRLELSDYQLMADAYFAEAKLYDGLLNKYYKLLLATLHQTDKPILVQAQRAWLAYRDSEYNLTELINHIEFDTGTMQNDVNASNYADLVRERVKTLFLNYSTVKTLSQNY